MISIYTDGSAVANTKYEHCGKGGFGIVFVVDGEVKKTISEGYFPTKTGRMELKAVLRALKTLSKDQKAIIRSDSMYVVNCFNRNWLWNWNNEGWPARIKNQDILKLLLKEYKKFPNGNIKFKHIKGHNGDEMNELADNLASYKNFETFKKDL